MISGLNTDVEFEGKVYHIQTEDGGLQNPIIVTHLFHSGAIVSSRKTSYATATGTDGLAEVVRGMMKDQHRSMIKELISGRFRDGQKPFPQAPPQKVEAKPQQVEAKPQKSVSQRKSLDDLILDYLSSREAEEKGKRE